jgi:hypothetical protein
MGCDGVQAWGGRGVTWGKSRVEWRGVREGGTPCPLTEGAKIGTAGGA